MFLVTLTITMNPKKNTQTLRFRQNPLPLHTNQNDTNIMLTITAGEFKANQQHYLDQIDEGEEIIVERSHGRSYMIIPLTEKDVMSDTEYIMEPDEDLKRAISIDELIQRVKVDIHEMFKSRK